MQFLEYNLHTNYSKFFLDLRTFQVSTTLIMVIENWNGLNFRFLCPPCIETWVLLIFKIEHIIAPQIVLLGLSFCVLDSSPRQTDAFFFTYL